MRFTATICESAFRLGRTGIPEETRRAWLIVERNWTRMAEREELKDAMSWMDDDRQVQAALRNGQ